jgi:uncharacterized membrane protein
VAVSLFRRLECSDAIDVVARRLAPLADAVVRNRRLADGLRGTWIGHALHPLLTDFPLGSWMSASFLDLFGGPDARRPAQRLVGFGLLAALPTAAAGLAEWQATAGGARRVGVVHAAGNTTATTLYGLSWLARRSGRHQLGARLGVGGGVVATVGGYLGGHLSLVRKIGSADAGYGADLAVQERNHVTDSAASSPGTTWPPSNST